MSATGQSSIRYFRRQWQCVIAGFTEISRGCGSTFSLGRGRADIRSSPSWQQRPLSGIPHSPGVDLYPKGFHLIGFCIRVGCASQWYDVRVN
ncbi:hypothetical protein GWI33_012926 [Rhynchophorus ferrugineus]|uniref:Uncharacterized protein n=1 Tax=Rhynchophorus ferrugineus TaxID=354439 RepID=A0A834IAE4_RHYFE|nr:hypothetical protein GWI33_012926 [Rhynchophorus ferrugineus]